MEGDFRLFCPKGLFLGVTCKMPSSKFDCGVSGHLYVRKRTAIQVLWGFLIWKIRFILMEMFLLCIRFYSHQW
jgi:hypothetical protein